MWIPHDPGEISAFEQNLLSIQRLYLCQAVLAKEPEREVVGAQCWQLLEQGLAVWQHGQGRGLAAWGWQTPPCSSSSPPCIGSVSTVVFQSQVTSDALSGLVSSRGQLLMWGEMLEAGLGERETACGSMGLKLDCAGQEELSLGFPPFPRWKLLGWGCGLVQIVGPPLSRGAEG